MAAHGGAAHHEDEEEIHLPPPSFSPVIIAIGVTIACFGLLSTPILIAAGGVILLIGLATWLIDDARAFGSAPDTGHGGH
ncbi:MAG TPA: hypothetical protein VFW12_03265 [Candidatus Limnocylindria bacterium]|nr:hypothetical protein [Candidatus Limnocylindria bacterium]